MLGSLDRLLVSLVGSVHREVLQLGDDALDANENGVSEPLLDSIGVASRVRRRRYLHEPIDRSAWLEACLPEAVFKVHIATQSMSEYAMGPGSRIVATLASLASLEGPRVAPLLV
jgi:hypothetical protein